MESELGAKLLSPFEPSEVKFKPQAVKGDRALALAYVDARVIQDRLDDVLGPCGWRDAYDVLDGGSVRCRLSIRMDGGEWVTKEDVGSPSEQPDDGDRMKAAFSDALKRAAVKWGIGRYLYRLPQQWVGYDPAKKRFSETIKLPEWALPAKTAKPVANGTPAASTEVLPKDGMAFWEKVHQRQAELVKAGKVKDGELAKAVLDGMESEMGANKNYDSMTLTERRQAVQVAKRVIKGKT